MNNVWLNWFIKSYSRHKVRHHKNPKGHYYSSYPSYRGNKGNRVKSVSSSSITYSFGNKKYYAKGHAYLSKSSLNKLGVSSSKLAEIAYQESYNYYLSTKNKERAKVNNPDIHDFFDNQEYYKKIKQGDSNSPSINSMGGQVPIPKRVIIFFFITFIGINYDVFSKVIPSNSFQRNSIKYLEFVYTNNDTRMTSVLVHK